LDENIQVSKYKPQSLIGTSINSKRVTTKNIDFFTDTFLKPNERKNHFQKIIRNSLSLPNKFELITISKKDHLLAFVIFDRTSESKLKIPIFRFLNSSLSITLTKHLLFKSILTSINEERTLIEIKEKYLEDDIKNAIQETRFTKLNNYWQKVNIKDVLDTKNLYSKINQETNTKNIITNINANLEDAENVTEFIKKYNYERFLSPLKIKDLEIPSYIVFIKPHWAEQLFNDKSKEKLDLFELEYELLLKREYGYYLSSSPKIINDQTNDLWYYSENKTKKEKNQINQIYYFETLYIEDPKN